MQTCLTELGYYKGPVDGKRGRETWTAYWNFKHDHGLGGYSDLLAEPVRQKLDELCIETAAIEPSPGATGRAGGDRCLLLSLSLQTNRTWPRMKARVSISTACPTI